MGDNTQPLLLTIGIIFKNEIRCLERCLKSLIPLREAIACELIMADTGSADGSREVAARYADILFDFPWTQDFSAARNAVMDRASGRWYFTVDADEYLDSNISEIVEFLRFSGKYPELICGVVQRNYDTIEMDSKYSDFLAVRLVNMSTGLRYQGAIHEAWPSEEKGIRDIRALSHTILHHDGYVGMDGEQGKAKRERNLALLRRHLAQEPEDLKTLLQYIESGRRETEYMEILRRAIAAVEERRFGWQLFGPPIFRHAVKAALEEELSEFWEWTAQAERWFPDSLFVQIDIEYIAFTRALKEGDYNAAIRRGEHCLQAIKSFRKDKEYLTATVFSTLLMSSPYWEQGLEIYLADIYIKEGNPVRAGELLMNIDGTLLDAQQTGNMLCVLGDLQRLSYLDTALMIRELFQGIRKSVPSEETAKKRSEIFFQTAALAFLPQTRKEEQTERNYCRPSYMLFYPLAEQCDIGRGAVILASESTEEMRHVLTEVEDWNQLPIEALSHALEQGVCFPLSERPLKLEDMTILAERMVKDREDFCSVLRRIAIQEPPKDLQRLTWMRTLLLSSIQFYNWKNETADGMFLARLYVRTEKEFLSRHYTSELLRQENLNNLPALSRFGWHCVHAFRQLEAGSLTEYVQELRAGLHTCKAMTPMVEYLLEHTPELKKKEASAELLSLAEQVRSLLEAYSPENPAVAAIKASPVYQKVAWLIEGDKE